MTLDTSMHSEEEVFGFLTDLRDSAVTNMFGAGPYLMDEFGFDKKTAKAWLMKWMKSFD